jgi:hypothetical protein
MSVALLMDQRSVADWPFSIWLGSAVKLPITVFAGGGAGWTTGAGGGGGGGGGTFFLQADANTNNISDSKRTPNLAAFDRNWLILKISFGLWNTCFSPYGF